MAVKQQVPETSKKTKKDRNPQTSKKKSAKVDGGGIQGRKDLKFLQLNMHKAEAAQNILTETIRQEKINVCLVQEPRTYKGNVISKPRSMDIFLNKSQGNPRAAVFADKKLKGTFLEKLSTRDCAAVLLDIGASKTIVASIYLDINHYSILR